MTEILIISDLHLSGDRPGTTELFFRFLEEQLTVQSRLYILGDLFDAWIGDDDCTPPVPDIKARIKQASAHGAEIFFMHGNRDFLVGQDFAAETGCTLLDDPAVIHLNGVATLLMHGDLLCSDDQEYQKARLFLRSPGFIKDMLSRSIDERRAIAADFRKRSGEINSLKAEYIMDVNQQTVETYMRRNQVTLLIHGHTHRPDTHQFTLDGRPAQRIVLPEWHEARGGYLKADNNGVSIHDYRAQG